ncbi:hypothetical protein PTRA_a1785 [Pseudoalteromonas translucida KMM 520]|uniref:DUF7305 domain-containing protein n=1 Tax=Pseudoalteromonas translucida KMM 520 TaxID=1315283 RepID=A0A0U2X2D2_9GAMM|nr:polymer-forming cytoskeletal protein [Pseudoalteromonas translucida]ALS32946.1 hypothetical protein PTRA_a1785 [Pseudoalteromonas translucida KMM 520]
MKNSSGFTLIIVLLLTSLASIVVLSSLKDTVFQERLSGNFQKKLNARLMSEKGIYVSMENLHLGLSNKPLINIEDLVATNSESHGDGSLEASKYHSAIEVDGAGNILIISQGNRFEGEARMQAEFEFIQGQAGTTTKSAFPSGVVSCSDITYGGHTAIDSYDSSLGDYNDGLIDGSTNVTKKAIIKVLGDPAVISLGGAKSAIYGDIFAVGDLTIDGRTISGNVHSNASITIIGKTEIGGNAAAFTNYTQSSGTVLGDVTANGQVNISGSAKVYGKVKSAAGLVEQVAITGVDTKQAAVCDSLNLRQEVQNIKPNFPLADLTLGNTLILKTKSAANNASFTAIPSTFLNVATDIYYFNNVQIKKGELKIADNHNVVMFVNGNFSLAAKGLITIPENSSLTLIVKGQVDITSNSIVNTPNKGVTQDGRPVFSIYSAYEGNAGVSLSGGHKQVYAVVYAPYTEVTIRSNSGFKGSVLAGKLVANGGGAIHYDRALGKASFGGTVVNTPTTPGRLVFKRWVFVPAEQENNAPSDD